MAIPSMAIGGQEVEVVRWTFWKIALENTHVAGRKANLPFFLFFFPIWDSGIMARASAAILDQDVILRMKLHELEGTWDIDNIIETTSSSLDWHFQTSF